jgi:Domain of unknown function (DUF4158)
VVDEDELIEDWTLVGGELAEVAGKRGPTRLAFALLLKFYTRRGRFPRGRGELPDEAVAYVARQVKVPAADLGLYEWSGRTFEYHRAQIRTFLGFRECTVADADKLTAWLTEHVCCKERRPERVREQFLEHCRDERIEPPAASRAGRIIGSAMRQAEQTLTLRVSARIPPEAAARMAALIAGASDDPGQGDGQDGPEVFAVIKADPGNVSLKTTREEIAKLTAIRAIGLPAGLFGGIAPKVLAAWRARAAAEAPSHLRAHPEEIRLTLLAALLHCREREITDTLVDLLIATVRRINARAEKKVVDELVSDLKRVSGKESILFGITAAAIEAPGGVVRDVIYPAAGGEQTLLDLLREYKAKGSSFRQHKQRVFKASYTSHYRHGLVELIQALDFHSANTAHRPVIEALELIKRYGSQTTGAVQYYAPGERVPVDGVVPADLQELLYRADKRGRQRIQRTVYECGVFQTLRDKLRCKEIWVTGADRWRNPDEDLPADFEASRAENYAALRKPLDPAKFASSLREEMHAELAALNDALPDLDWLQLTQRKSGADHSHPARRRSGAAEPAPPQGCGQGPLGHGAAAGHADRDSAAHRLPERLHLARHPRAHRPCGAVRAAAAGHLRLRHQHWNPGRGRG